MKEVKAKIVLHRRISSDYFRLQLICPEIARQALPGQFLMLRVSELRDPFLRRPFAFSRIFLPQEVQKKPLDEGGVEICYQVRGRGTTLMTQLKEGQRLDLLGPLGNGFWAVEDGRRPILVGGGIGIAPLLCWAQELLKARPQRKKSTKYQEENSEVIFLVGGKSQDKILGVGECRRMGIEPRVATEDGSLGVRGLVTDLLERELLTGQHKSPVLYACGPMPMLARVAQIADQFDLPCQVLLESRMACGVGACLGCTVKFRKEGFPKEQENPELKRSEEGSFLGSEEEERVAREGLFSVIAETPLFRYARVCKEGPVFDARRIFWD